MTDYVTIEGFENLTAQEVFDLSAKHLLTTRAKSVRRSQSGIAVCTFSGTGCAARPFVDLDRLHSSQLDTSWDTLHDKCLVPSTHVRLISDLQFIHDSSEEDGNFMREWKSKMRELAKRDGLNTKLIDEDDAKC